MEKQKQINQMQGQVLEHKSLLFATDYVVIRNQETGQPIPEDVLQERAQARLQIRELELQIQVLEDELAEEKRIEEANVQLRAELNKVGV